MARDAIAFIAAMQFGQVDRLGFSIGSFVAQQIALVRPAIVHGLTTRSASVVSEPVPSERRAP
jgi:pimeloyl-ACP methyl ester carboxylesterase